MPLEAILEKISAEAQRQVDGILEEAEQTRRLAQQEAESQAKSLRESILEEAETKVEHERARLLHRAHLSNLRNLVNVQETAFRAAQQVARERLALMRQQDDYDTILAALLDEALGGMTEAVNIQLDPRDGDLLRSLLATRNRQGDTLEEVLETWGGLKISVQDGRVIRDNTLERRLDRAMPDLRPLLADLFTTSASDSQTMTT